MAYIGLTIDPVFAAAACGRSTAELHVTLVHVPIEQDTVSSGFGLPGALLLSLDELWAGTQPQPLTLGAVERFGNVLVRRARGDGLLAIRRSVLALLEEHGVRCSNDFDPCSPHCSIGLAVPGWSWTFYGERSAQPGSIAVHSSLAVFAGLRGVVAHHWNLGA